MSTGYLEKNNDIKEFVAGGHIVARQYIFMRKKGLLKIGMSQELLGLAMQSTGFLLKWTIDQQLVGAPTVFSVMLLRHPNVQTLSMSAAALTCAIVKNGSVANGHPSLNRNLEAFFNVYLHYAQSHSIGFFTIPHSYTETTVVWSTMTMGHIWVIDNSSTWIQILCPYKATISIQIHWSADSGLVVW